MNINPGAAQQAQQATSALNQRFQSLTSDQIDEAVLEADRAWRDEGKRKAYSRHLANALVARLPGQPWISVEERLPKSTPGSDEVVFFSPDMRNPTDQAIGVLRYGRWLSAGVEFVNVTHWKPRDQPPLRRSEDAAAIKRPEVHRLSKSELQTIERAAHLLEQYAAFIDKVKPVDFELHPYVPELETTAESLREILAAEPKRKPIPAWQLQHWIERRLRAAGPNGITNQVAFAEEVMRWTEAQLDITPCFREGGAA